MARVMPASAYTTTPGVVAQPGRPATGYGGYTSYPGSASSTAPRPVATPAPLATPSARQPYRVAPTLTQQPSAPRIVQQAASAQVQMQQQAPAKAAASVPARIALPCRSLIQAPSGLQEASSSVSKTRRNTAPEGGLAPDSELAHLLLLLRNPNLLAQYATKSFRRADTDGNGVLSLEELMNLMPILHQEIGLSRLGHSEDLDALVRFRMRKYDLNGDGVLSLPEFLELYRWTLWLKYEDLDPPIQSRREMIKAAHKGNPSTYYKIGGKIGQGQFGVVNLAKHRDSGEDRVLKTINKRMAVQAGTPLAMLSQEMDILALLDHPHILRLFEHYNDTENIYIVTDVCYGGHLLEIVEEHCSQCQPLPEAWVARVFKQAIEAIGYCHSKGVMHKDVKFENLMLNQQVTCNSPLQDIHVVVIDVGLSELFGAPHGKGLRSNLIAGSPATMAPEVIRRNFSFKCDIWSFGCLLYAIFNNRPAYLPDGAGGQVLYTYPFAPVQTESDPFGIEGLLQAQMAGPNLEMIEHASPAAQDAVVRMLACDERTRPSALECLNLHWFSEYNPTSTFSLSDDQVKALSRDKEVNLLKRTVTLEAATQLPVSAVYELEQEFEALAASTGGTMIENSVFAMVLEGKGVARDVAEKVVECADLDKSGMIEWSEFLAAMLPACHELFAQMLQRAFQEYDVDNDGSLDRSEVERMLRDGQLDTMHMPTTKTIDMMIQELDENHDGRISFSEFHDYLLREHGQL